MATEQFSPVCAVPPIECALCKVLGAKFACATCGTYYCNAPCQLKHWPTHKDSCVPRLIMVTAPVGTAVCPDQAMMPVPSTCTVSSANKPPSNEEQMNQQKAQLVSHPTTDGKLLQQGPFPKPGSKVKISYVADDKMYIYEASTGSNGGRNGHECLITRFSECARSVKHHLSVPPTVDDIVFGCCDGIYHRAVIKSVKNELAEVFYPDVGNSQTVHWNTLKDISDPEIKYADCLTHGVCIESVAAFTPPIKEFLKPLVNEADFTLITVIEAQNMAGIKMVEMFNCGEKYVLGFKLLDLETAHSPKKQRLSLQPELQKKTLQYEVTNPYTYTPVLFDELIETAETEGEGIELVIVNATTTFIWNVLHAMTKSNFTRYKAMMHECEMYGNIDQNPYEPALDEVCLVNYRDIWYRARVLEIAPGGTRSLHMFDADIYADDGCIKMRRYPPGLTRHKFVMECELGNTNVLLKAIDGNKENVDQLHGKLIKVNIRGNDILFRSDITSVTICK